jgi:cation:H+ antiporter
VDIWTVVMFVAGLAALVGGAEYLVSGASGISERFGVPPVVIGLTVVAFGTGAPELVVSIVSGIADETDLALGNVLGSNIANILLILGLSAVVGTVAVKERIVKVDLPLVLVAGVVTLLLALDRTIGRWDGVLLVGAIVAYTVWLVRQSREVSGELAGGLAEEVADIEAQAKEGPVWLQAGLVLGGLALLAGGSWLVVESSTRFATELGISELVVGLTIVSIGTSLPELATSVMAVRRGQRDIAVGNVVGSNLFNLTAALGATAAVADSGVPVATSALTFDFPVMLGTTLLLLPMAWGGLRITRSEGAILVLAYGGFLAAVVALA